jgi:transposase InsO family protein
MTKEKRMFPSYEKNEDPQRVITFGDGNQGLVKGLGKIAISPDHSTSNVFLVDSLYYNFLSVSQLCKMGYNCLFTNTGVTVFRRSDDSVAFKGVLEGQLYLVDFNRAELDTCLIAKTNMGWLWHRRLAHVGMKNLHKLLKGEHILGLTNVHFEKGRVCSACQARKQVGTHHPHKNIMTTDRPVELLHMDLFGPIAYINIGGSKYSLVIVDDYSRFTWEFFLQEKSQTQETLKGFLRRAQNEFRLRIKKIRSDNGTEFKNSQIEGFLDEEGIKHEFSSPYTPQRNGVVERKNRTLLDMARTMLDEYKTPDRFWAEAINIACYSINWLYLHRILKKTSYELLTGKKPNVSYFIVFGSKCFILIKRDIKLKFAPKAVEGFLLGYDSNTRAYRVFNKSTGLVEVSCDIVFDETNGSQVEQVDLDELDDEEAPCVALRNMSIGDVCPKESEEPPQAQDQPSSSMQASRCVLLPDKGGFGRRLYLLPQRREVGKLACQMGDRQYHGQRPPRTTEQGAEARQEAMEGQAAVDVGVGACTGQDQVPGDQRTDVDARGRRLFKAPDRVAAGEGTPELLVHWLERPRPDPSWARHRPVLGGTGAPGEGDYW